MGQIIDINGKKKENEPVKKRLGKFYISGIMVRNHHGAMAETLAYIRLLPTNVSFNQEIDTFVYIGMSYFFEEINLGDPIPEYELIVHNNKETGEFERVEALRKKRFLVDEIGDDE